MSKTKKARNSSPALKTQAKALRKYLAEQGIELKHSQSLEAIARCQGYKDWNTATACASMPLFTVSNHHAEDCGTPPSFNGDHDGYFSYFENSRGEQAIFHYDREKDRASLYMGDAGWESPVWNSTLTTRWCLMNQDRALDPQEIAWFSACYRATARPGLSLSYVDLERVMASTGSNNKTPTESRSSTVIDEIITMLEEGSLQLPEFQKPVVWPKAMTKEFIRDCLHRCAILSGQLRMESLVRRQFTRTSTPHQPISPEDLEKLKSLDPTSNEPAS